MFQKNLKMADVDKIIVDLKKDEKILIFVRFVYFELRVSKIRKMMPNLR